MALSLPPLFIAKLIRLQNNKDINDDNGAMQNHNSKKTPQKSTKVEWYKDKNLKEMPGYLFWPDEKRYSKVLFWGYGYSGLHFIEEDFEYGCAADNKIFLPAEEKDYLQYMQEKLSELRGNGNTTYSENLENIIRAASRIK